MTATPTQTPQRPAAPSTEPAAPRAPRQTRPAGKPFAMIGEFDSVDAILHAARAAYDAGYRRMDVHSPFPVHGIDGALRTRQTVLPWIVLVMGLTGMTLGIALTVYTMGTWTGVAGIPVSLESYPYLISGKPYYSLAAYVPVIFELTILFSAYTAVFAMFFMNKLPMLFHPLSKSDTFRRCTDDRFILAIEATDPHYDPEDTRAFLNRQHALSTEIIRD